MTQTNNIVAKLAVAFVAVAMAFSLVAPAAQAQDVSSMSLEQLIALVNSLQTQLSGSVTTSSTCSYTFTRSLGQGATGADVMNLQKFLNSDPSTVVAVSGAGSAGMETSYYGPATAAAVSKFQTKYSADILVPSGLTSPTGYFGPSSMAKANKLCDGGTTPTGPGTGTGTGGLQGGAGDLDAADFITSINNEDVGEGQDDVEVLGLDLEASDGSDIRLTAVRVEFEQASGQTGSDDLDDYASEVTIWLDGKQVGSVDVDDMRESGGIWSDTVSLDTSAVITRGDSGELVVAVTAVGNIDGDDEGSGKGEWNVAVASVRFVDAQGAVLTETSLDDIGPVDTGSDFRGFTFDSFASANDVELTFSESDENPDAGVVQAEDSGDEVVILIGEMEAEGSDIELTDLTVVIDPSSVNSVEEIASEFLLMVDGEEVASVDADECEVVASTCSDDNGVAATYVFEDIDFVIDEGDTVEFSIVAVLNEVGVDFTAGQSLTASITVNATNVKAEDEAGDDLTDGELKGGTVNGNAVSFASEGITVKMTDSDASPVLNLDTTSADDQGKFEMTFEVTAFDQTAWVELNGASSTDATTDNVGAAFSIENASTGAVVAGGTTTGVVLSRVSGGTVQDGFVRITDGQTATFKLTVYYDAASEASYRLQLNEVGYAATKIDATAAHNVEPDSDFESEPVLIKN